MKINGATAIIKSVLNEGVNTIFGHPGGAVLPLYKAMKDEAINHVLVKNEQSAAHMASGYSRVTDQVGVCLVTSGPGATNLITGIATAYQDSIPIVAITGQVNSKLIGRDLFQEADIVGSTEPFTKHNYLIKDVKDIPRIMKEAFYIANTGRKGPVLVDIPKDIQETLLNYEYPTEVNLRGYKPTISGNDRQIKRMIDKMGDAIKPLICVGGGVRLAGATDELNTFVDKTHIPVVSTLMGFEGLDNRSPYYAGIIGSHGYEFANKALNEADLLIVIGARFNDRTIFFFDRERNKKIIHIDIDPAEIGKNVNVDVPIVGDCKDILTKLNIYEYDYDFSEWNNSIQIRKQKFLNLLYGETGYDYVNPNRVIMEYSNILPNNAIVTADVGRNQIWTAHNYVVYGKRRYLSSGGLGTMGYSLSAAIGTSFANQNRQILAVAGDGGIQMFLGEIALLKEYNINMVLLIFNNSSLGMVKELQNNKYGADSYFGVNINSNPDYMKIAEAYGITGFRLTNNDEIKDTIKNAMDIQGPAIIECIVDPNLPSLLQWR